MKLDFAIAVLCLLSLASIVAANEPTSFVVVANNALAFDVVQLPHQCPAGICKGKCNCTERSKCGTPNYCPTTIPAPLPPRVAYRLPVGHTHTCTNCGESWDHGMDNGSHRCPFCKVGHPPINSRGQYLTDPVPRLVKVQVTQHVPVAMPPDPPIVKASTPLYSPFGEWKSNNPAAGGGCANGQCGATQRGLFRRW